MEVAATVTTKGQVTIPKEVREALGIEAGDQVVFKVEEHRAVLARTADLLSLAGSVDVPSAKRAVPWNEIIASTRRARARGSV